ncbi:hypothetical protein BKA61DRAFT_208618 [Leptodontidium sp. MPI-SDFR-AT-0119]|nr:hypothetical protein BKA61DRAFT_208618 [Leptodontidium sp. MPI-SDFR-AT-0119]
MESMAPPAHRDESADEYSDLASVHSDTAPKRRRKHQRGGRKAGYEEPTPEETAGLLRPEDSPDHEQNDQDEGDTCQYCARKSQPRRKIAEPFETGIRAFNVRKAAGVKRPVAVRTTSDKKKSKPPAAKPVVKRAQSSKTDDPGYESQSQKSGPKNENEDEESEEQDDAAGAKPMSIRLDLDLMIEVFLKAKIKGEVTITFLE